MEGIGKQSLEEFWGAELSSKKKVFSWADDSDEETEDMFVDKTLELRQACLGVSAKEGERNVVQVVAENDEGEEVRHTFLSLRVGGTEQCSLFLSLNPPVSFELVSGSGPVHIMGSMLETMSSMDDFSDESSDEEDDISNSEVTGLVNSAKKRPATSPVAKPAKQIKLDSSTSSDNNTSAKIAPVKRSKKKPVMQEELNDEEDDDDDDEDMSEGDENMSDEEEEEEEEEIKPPTKKPQNNGKAKQKELTKKLFKFDTPQPAKPAVKATKGTKSAPTTPKQSEKKVGGMKNNGQKKRKNKF